LFRGVGLAAPNARSYPDDSLLRKTEIRLINVSDPKPKLTRDTLEKEGQDREDIQGRLEFVFGAYVRGKFLVTAQPGIRG